MCRSVPQMPVFLTRIRQSLMPTVGSGTSVRVRPGAGVCFTKAFIESVPHHDAKAEEVSVHLVNDARTTDRSRTRKDDRPPAVVLHHVGVRNADRRGFT